jgi:hypothetical protein
MFMRFMNGARGCGLHVRGFSRLLKAPACLTLCLLLAWLALAGAEAATPQGRAKRSAGAQARPVGKRARGLRRSAGRKSSARVDALEPRADGEDPEGRGSWFYFKRAYPFGYIPPDARRRASGGI